MARITLVLASLVLLLAVVSAIPRTVTAPVYHCSHLILGRKTTDEIIMPDRTVGSHDYLYVQDECKTQQKKWVGENVTACDSTGSFGPTILPFGIGSFSPLYINCAQENPHPCYELIIATYYPKAIKVDLILPVDITKWMTLIFNWNAKYNYPIVPLRYLKIEMTRVLYSWMETETFYDTIKYAGN